MALFTKTWLFVALFISPLSASEPLTKSMAMLESKIEKLIDQQSELKQRSDQQAGLIKKLKEKVAEQENENVLQRTEIHRLQKSVQVLNNRIQQLEISKIDRKVTEVKAAVLRTCEEIRRSDPTSKSGTYLIDPDGDAFGDPPVTVYCNMTTGATLLSHDSENVTVVDKCNGPGCYARRITYNATAKQVSALVQQSRFCQQSVKFDCLGVPFQFYDAPQAWWNDWNGTPQYFWSGSDAHAHTCQCGIDGNCVDSSVKCNCDSLQFIELHDDGVITAKNALPVSQINFGRTSAPSTYGRYTLGKLECSGRDVDDRMPESCADLWKIGYKLNGFFDVKGDGELKNVYCDFSKTPGEDGLQTMIGSINVKSTPVYFHVQRNSTFSSPNQNVTLPFNIEVTNVGNAMDLRKGIFTAPKSGTYFFVFSGVQYDGNRLYVSLMLNGHQVASTAAYNSLSSLAIVSTLKLETDDEVSLTVTGYSLFEDADRRYTQFTGILLQEELSF